MASKRDDQFGRYRAVQLATALYSLLFIYFVASGYITLFEKTMPVFGYVAGAVFALVAWNLAKIIGSDEGGIPKYRPLFILLLMISALGIFNSLFIKLESKPILQETVLDSREKFAAAKIQAQRTQDRLGISDRQKAVDDALKQLNDEIANPMKCGQGPKAMEAIRRLETLLPGFAPLAGGAGAGCSETAAVTAAYTSKVNQLKGNAKWNNSELQEVLSASNTAIGKLNQAQLKAAEGSVSGVTRILDEVEPTYTQAVYTLKRYDDESQLPANLDLVQVKSIGEWSQILNLVRSRLDEPSTYLYFVIAVFADWMMIYFFNLLRENGVRPGAGQKTRPGVRIAW